MTRSRTSKQFFAALTLVFVTAVWGGTFPFVKWTVATTDVYWFLFLRFLLAALTLLAVAPRKIFLARRSTVRAAAILSFFLGASYVTQTEGLRFTGASNSALITGLYMVMVPALAMFTGGERPSQGSVAGAFISALGLYLLTAGSLAGFNLGDALCLLTALTYAGHLILTGRWAAKHEMMPLVAFQFFFIALAALAVALVKGTAGAPLSALAWGTIVATALPATALAFLVQVAAQRVIDATRTGIIFALEAPFGVLFSWCIGGERMTAVSAVGAAAMVAGMFTSEFQALRRSAAGKMRRREAK